MSNSERDNFEEEWNKAFEDAESEPSPLVWSGIEKRLAHPKLWDQRPIWLIFLLLLLLSSSVLFLLWLSGQEAGESSLSSQKSLDKTQNTDNPPGAPKEKTDSNAANSRNSQRLPSTRMYPKDTAPKTTKPFSAAEQATPRDEVYVFTPEEKNLWVNPVRPYLRNQKANRVNDAFFKGYSDVHKAPEGQNLDAISIKSHPDSSVHFISPSKEDRMLASELKTLIVLLPLQPCTSMTSPDL
ncbi:MAG: hypothetical protein HC880_00960 [Bacteroidia bacterium]|nr:hypothetical protein [Bacteroidia bacterium]